jgi:hypothetical protein
MTIQLPQFPPLFGAADEAAIDAQAEVVLLFKAKTAILIVAAVVVLVPDGGISVAFASTVLFLTSLGVHIYGEYKAPQRQWYSARALAESIKTSSWRLLMGAEPFTQGDPAERVAAFMVVVKELIDQNQEVVKFLSPSQLGLVQVTDEFRMVMSSSFATRRELYSVDRIEDQRSWYVKRTASNRGASRRIFWAICAAYGIALVLLLLRMAIPSWQFLPIDAIAVVATSFIGWKELRRYDELASAYALTAVELGFIRDKCARLTDQAGLAGFVSDAENAFSREHTQWAARRDHAR